MAESYKVPQKEAKEAEKSEIYCPLWECQLGISWGQEGQKVTSSNFTDIEAATEGTSSHKQFWKKPRNTAASKIDNDVILLLWQPRCKCNTIITNFHPYLIQEWWYFFQVFVNGNEVNAQTWKVGPMKNPVKPSSITLTFNCQSYLFICCMAYRFYFFHEFFYLLFIIIIICYFEVAQGTHL